MGLIGTGDLRTWMGVEEGDKNINSKLSAIALSVEDFVDSFTNRKLMATTYYQDIDYSYLDGTGRNFVYLPVYPVSYVSDVRLDADHVFGSGSIIGSASLFWYSSGKLVSKNQYFSRGRRNLRVDYIAGYAPVTGGTHDSSVSTYPIPHDLKQTMVEMCVESIREGITGVHTVERNDRDMDVKFTQMLSRNSFWRATLNKFKAFDIAFLGREE